MFIIGAGVVGTTLAARLLRVGVPVVGLHGRRSDLSKAASAASGVLASSGELPAAGLHLRRADHRRARHAHPGDRPAAARRQAPAHEQVVLHASGSRPAGEVLAPAKGQVAGVGTMHPLIAVTDSPGSVENLAGRRLRRRGRSRGRPPRPPAGEVHGRHAAGAEARDDAALPRGGGHGLELRGGAGRRRPLAAGGRRASPRRTPLPALWPLMASAVRNLKEIGLPGALTGPVARGDVVSVERHLEALAARAPEHARRLPAPRPRGPAPGPQAGARPGREGGPAAGEAVRADAGPPQYRPRRGIRARDANGSRADRPRLPRETARSVAAQESWASRPARRRRRGRR